MILEEILMAKDSASAEPGAKELPFSTYTQPNPRQCTDAIKKKKLLGPLQFQGEGTEAWAALSCTSQREMIYSSPSPQVAEGDGGEARWIKCQGVKSKLKETERE